MTQFTQKIYSRFKTISLYGLGQAVGPVGQLVLSFLIVQYRSVELWGDYVQNLIIVNLLMLFGSFGHRDFLIREFSRANGTIGEIWTKSLVNRLLICLIAMSITFALSVLTISIMQASGWMLLLFGLNSFAVIVLFKRDFKFQLTVELLTSILLLILCWFLMERLTVSILVSLVVITTLIKLVAYVLRYTEILKDIRLPLPSYEFLKQHFQFFALTAVSTLQSTCDLYIVAYLLTNKELGYYHIIVKLMGVGKMGGSYIAAPYIKNLFRLSHATVSNLIKKVMPWSFVLAVLVVIAIHLVLKYNFSLELTYLDYLLIYLFFPPFFLYAPSIYYLLKSDNLMRVTKIAVIQMIISILVGYVLVDHFQLTGGLAAATIGQWVAALIFFKEFLRVRVSMP